MAIFGALWDPVIAIFVVLALAEYVKIRTKVAKELNWIAAGGVIALLGAATSTWILALPGEGANILGTYLGWLWGVIAFILVLVGALGAASKLLKSK